jgi:hypothetical protein
MTPTKYEKLRQIIIEDYDSSFDATADMIETLTYRGELFELLIDQIVETGEDTEDYISEIIAIVSRYDEYINGYNLDDEENHELKNSDEY